MNHLTFIRRAFVDLGPILGVAFALAGHAQSLPEGPGKAELQRTCSTCHSITVVTARRLSNSGWQSVIDNMITRGAQMTPEEEKQIASYLTANFGAASSQSSEPESDETEEAPVHAPAQPAPILDASQIVRAKELMQANGCHSCHRIDGQGSYAGPYLGDVGARHTAEEIRSSLVSPARDLAPQNRSVRLVARDGKTVVGKLLNQDGFSVQLIDASGRLLTFQRANLQDFTILTVNPMPSYGGKMPAPDLSLLIQYLETQTGTGQKP